MRKILTILLMILGIGSTVFAGTYRNYDYNILRQENMFTFGGYSFMENKPNSFEYFENETWYNASKDIVKQFVNVVPNFNGAVSYPMIINGKDPSTLLFIFKNGKHIKTLVYRWYYDPEKDISKEAE